MSIWGLAWEIVKDLVDLARFEVWADLARFGSVLSSDLARFLDRFGLRFWAQIGSDLGSRIGYFVGSESWVDEEGLWIDL